MARSHRTSVRTILLIVALNWAMTAVLTYLALYWFMPHMCNLIPTVGRYYSAMSDEQFYTAYESIRAVCAVLALFPAAHLAMRFSRRRKKAFLTQLKTLPTQKAALIQYLHTDFKPDCIVTAILLAVILVLFCINPRIGFIRLFPMAEALYTYCGSVLGLLLGLILFPPVLCHATHAAQNTWRAEYHLGL